MSAAKGKLRIATVSMARGLRAPRNRQDNLDYVARCFEEIAPLRLDLVCLPEVFPVSGIPNEGQSVCDADREFVCAMAAQHRTYVVAGIYEQREGAKYNTAVVADRSGRIAGRYDKIHPTEPELERGVRPGRRDQAPVDTELGRIGMQICFDANWPDDWKRLKDLGADLIVFPSAYPAGRKLEAMALLNEMPVVSAVQQVPSGIVDSTGRWMVQTDRLSWWVWAVLDLDRTVFHWDFQADKVRAIRKRYGDKVRIETFGHEAWFVLERASQDVSVAEIAREFDLTTRREYLARADRARDQVEAQSRACDTKT